MEPLIRIRYDHSLGWIEKEANWVWIDLSWPHILEKIRGIFISHCSFDCKNLSGGNDCAHHCSCLIPSRQKVGCIFRYDIALTEQIHVDNAATCSEAGNMSFLKILETPHEVGIETPNKWHTCVWVWLSLEENSWNKTSGWSSTERLRGPKRELKTELAREFKWEPKREPKWELKREPKCEFKSMLKRVLKKEPERKLERELEESSRWSLRWSLRWSSRAQRELERELKKELKSVLKEAIAGKQYEGIQSEPCPGGACSDWGKHKGFPHSLNLRSLGVTQWNDNSEHSL